MYHKIWFDTNAVVRMAYDVSVSVSVSVSIEYQGVKMFQFYLILSLPVMLFFVYSVSQFLVGFFVNFNKTVCVRACVRYLVSMP